MEVLGDQALYLLPEALINLEYYEAEPVGIHLPLTVDLKVIETVPGIKGATAAAQVKPAKCETGLVVTVPAFVNDDDVIRINTETGEYLLARVEPRKIMDQHRSAKPGWNRSDRRRHVQRQERGTDPPSAPRANREAARADFQAGHRHAVQPGRDRVAQRHEDSVRAGAIVDGVC
jgi:hypothetical protein